MHRFEVVIEGALQLLPVFLAVGTMAAGGRAEFDGGAVGALGFDRDISKPFGDAKEGLFHGLFRDASFPQVKFGRH